MKRNPELYCQYICKVYQGPTPRVYSLIGREDFSPLLTSALLGQWIRVTPNTVSSEEAFLHSLGQGARSSTVIQGFPDGLVVKKKICLQYGRQEMRV